MESLYVGSLYRIQALKGTAAKGVLPQLTKGWTIAEVDLFDSVQFLLVAIQVLLQSTSDPCQRFNSVVSRCKPDN